MCEPLFLCNKLFNLFSPPPYLICDEQRERRTASGVPTCLSFLTPPSFGHLPYMANATPRKATGHGKGKREIYYPVPALESFTALSSNDLKERLAFWVLSLTQQKSVDIRIICKQKDLYAFFGVQRSVFLSTLDELKEDGIIDYNAKEIIILDRSRLKDMLLGTSKDDF